MDKVTKSTFSFTFVVERHSNIQIWTLWITKPFNKGTTSNEDNRKEPGHAFTKKEERNHEIIPILSECFLENRVKL